jgi:oxygen-independent coproporphyrinogen-3 oxidase
MIGQGRGASAAPLAIYVHWPFCVSKCPYCDFNSHVAGPIDEQRWRAALIRDLDHFAADSRGRTVTSLFFGGGTPSLMDPATTATIVAAVRERWPVAGDVEITLEANPGSADAGRFRDFRAAGVGRVSIGVQSFDDALLRYLGRAHGAAEARAAVTLAAAVFPRMSLDLIYGLPGQTVGAWRHALADAVVVAGEHLSAYQLTIEPGTRFRRRKMRPFNEDLGLALYRTTAEILERAGWPAYEISNHARPGGECRHNLDVWRGVDYLGVGPGAHGRLTSGGVVFALRQTRSPAGWLAAVEARGTGLDRRCRLTTAERRTELVLTGLRLIEGLDRQCFRNAAGAAPEDVVDHEALDRLVASGDLEIDCRGLRATVAGRLRLDAVTAALLA